MSVETGQTIGVAIVGCGIIGRNHAEAIERTAGLAIVALVDAIPAASIALADAVEASGTRRPPTYDSLGAALGAGGVGLVVICTPSGLHLSLAEEAIDAAAHVVIEKPLDVRMDRGRRFLELSRRAADAGQVVSVISQHRFDPASVAVAAAARGGGFGLVTSGVASVPWWRSQEYYDSGQWRGTWELDGGGAVMNQGVHTVDLLLWFLGRPVEVSARTARLAHDRIEVEDVAVATLSFESGALATLHATTAAYPGGGVRLSVYGSRGMATIENDQLVEFVSDPTGPDAPGPSAVDTAASVAPRSGAVTAGSDPVPDGFVAGHWRQYRDVVDAIRTGRPPGVTVADALTALAVVRGIYVSARLDRPVRVQELLDGSLDDALVEVGA